MESYSKTHLFIEKSKTKYLQTIGVDHPSKTLKFRNESSLRMIKNNSYFNFRDYYKVKKYKETELTYQSSYEYHFLEFCEENKIFDRIENGNVYDFLPEEFDYGIRTITDYSIGDLEIEIKSSYILEKQGGYNVIDMKRSAVERAGKEYLLILDKDYSEFTKLFNFHD